MSVSLGEVTRGEEAWNSIRQANMFNDPPAAGFVYVLAKVRFVYLKGPDENTAYDLSPVAFTAVSCGGKDYETESLVEPDPTRYGPPCIPVLHMRGGSLSRWPRMIPVP